MWFQLILFLRGFRESERIILARITGIFLANGLTSASVINRLFEEFLVTNGEPSSCDTIFFFNQNLE